MRAKSGEDFDAERIGRNVRARRKAAGWTQAQLADRAGLAFETISRIESGREPPSLRTAMSIAKALEASLDLIVGRPHPLSAQLGLNGDARRLRAADTDVGVFEDLLDAASHLEPQALRLLTQFLHEVRRARPPRR